VLDKVALITAAGSGLGAACAREFAAAGYKVAVSSSSGKGEQLGKELGGLGLTASNTSANDIDRIVRETARQFGRIDVVVNSCGTVARGDLLAISDEDWHAALDMILLSVIRIARVVTPIFEQQGGGVIVNTTTYSAFEPDLTYPVSSALRAALGSFAKLYSDRYADKNIRMNNVLPGYVATRWPEQEAIKQRIPMKRYGTADEIAKTVAFLASDGAGYITGQNIRVDGGWTRSV
jgi:NAD(P)-dependent dehydrogenase (short-subunit alcohol dehydrogenase family)